MSCTSLRLCLGDIIKPYIAFEFSTSFISFLIRRCRRRNISLKKGLYIYEQKKWNFAKEWECFAKQYASFVMWATEMIVIIAFNCCVRVQWHFILLHNKNHNNVPNQWFFFSVSYGYCVVTLQVLKRSFHRRIAFFSLYFCIITWHISHNIIT